MTDKTKDIRNSTKEAIQYELSRRLGIEVDRVKQGAGTTIYGKTSRRFFRNCDVVSEITKIDKALIIRLAVVLEVITSNCFIDK